MSEVRIPGNGSGLLKPITARGDSRGESLKSINEHAVDHTDWRDTFREGLGVIGLAPKVENIDWSTRKVDDKGRVKVQGSDAFYGVSQPELQRGYELWRRGQINQSVGGNESERLFGKTPFSLELTDATSGQAVRRNEGDLRAANTTETTRIADVKEAMQLLNGLEVNAEGAGKKQALIQQLRSKPRVSADEVTQAYTSLLEFNPETITSRAQGDANLASTVQSTKSTAARTALEARQESNSHAIQMAEIDYKNDVNEYNWKNAEADRDYKWRAAEADREQKKTLTMLGYEDKRDERALSREDRRAENRQLMIMQLMKGLGNLGGAMAL